MNEESREDHAKREPVPSPVNGVALPVESWWKPGQTGNPKGRTTAGATIREHINSMIEGGLTEDEIRKIGRSKTESMGRRAAAERILRCIEAPDLSDFAGLMRGENTLEDLRAMGINTETVKKFKQKTRKVFVPGDDGEKQVEEVIDREIELHSRAGEDFDRVVNQTAGTPISTIAAKVETTNIPSPVPDWFQAPKTPEQKPADDPQAG